MTSKYTNKNGVKLLAAIAVFAMAFAAIGAITIVDVDGSETPVSITGENFLKLDTDKDGIITLEKDYALEDAIDLKTNLTVKLNGHTITGDRIFKLSKGLTTPVNLSIDGTVDGSAIDAKERVVVNSYNDDCTLTINGGTYSAEIPILWYTPGKSEGSGDNPDTKSTIILKNATFTATTKEYKAIWVSNSTNKELTIEGCEINSECGGVYSATVLKTTIKDTTINAKETAVEIKAGSVEIVNSILKGTSYVNNAGGIGTGGSGGAQAVIVINNGYVFAGGDGVSVSIDDKTTISKVAGDSKKLIAVAIAKAEASTVSVLSATYGPSLIEVEGWATTGKDAEADEEAKGLAFLSATSEDDLAAIKTIGAKAILTKDVTITKSSTLPDITLGKNKLTFAEKITVSAVVEGKEGSKATFTDYVVPTGSSLTLSSGSIIIESTGETIDSGATGTINIVGVAKVVGDTVINGTITLGAGSSLTIPEGTSLKANSITQISGANATVVVDGKLEATISEPSQTTPAVKVSSGAEVSGVDEGSITYNAGSGEFEFGDTLNSDYTVTKNEYLSSTLTIPEGVTLTIANGGVLNLNGSDIKVFGNLVIESGATISAAKGTESIQIMKGSVITNDGMIGVGSQKVTIAAGDIAGKIDGVGSVSITDVSGITFDLVNTGKTNGNNEAIYILTVSGDIISEGDNSAITITDARIVGDLTIGEEVTATIANSENVYMMSGSVVTVDGELVTNGKLVMKNKSTLVMNGILTGSIVAETADYLATGTYSTGSTTFTLTHDSNEKAFITSFELSVGTYTFSKKVGANYVDYIAQRLYINGTFDWKVIEEDENGYSGEIEITTETKDVNEVLLNTIISADSEIILDKGMKIDDSTTSKLKVDGKITIPSGATVNDKAYIGTQYSITVTNPTKVTTTYIEPFSKVISIIDTVDKKTIKVFEDVKVESEIAINEGQIIENNGTLTISESGKVTVNAKGTIKTNDIKTVQGTLIIMKGASCNAPVEYASKVSNVDYTKYTGIASAMDGLQAGDVVEINGTGDIKTKDLTIPAGVTVNISKDVEITGNLTIPADAKVNVKDNAELTVSGEKSKVIVNGTLDATDGTLTISKEKAYIQSEGTTVLKAANLTTLTDAKKVNAFVYTNEDNNKVLTNLADATKDAAAQDINNKSVDAFGTVNASVIDLATNLNVTAGSKVVVDTVNLASKKSITIADGAEFTGKITAQTGTDSKSTVSLTKAYDVTIASASVTENGENVKIMTIAGETPNGGIAISEGTVRTSGNMTFVGEDNVLTIDEGAELISKEGTIESTGNGDKAGIVIDGTYTVLNGATLNIDGIMIVNGILAIGDENDDVTVTGTLFVFGTVAVSTEGKAGKLNVEKEVVVGSNTLGANGTISGAVEIANSNSAFIKVYAGADMTAAQVNFVSGETTANATVFYINNTEYMTVYTKGAVTLGTIAETFKVSGLDLSNIAWYEADSTTAIGNGDSINGIDALYATAKAATVTGTISAGVGLQIYLNGISVENYKVTGGYKLPVGTYKVNIENLVGYDKTNAVISFNGATVTDGGSITISEKDFVLTATGAVPSDTPTPVEPSEKDDSMGITEYLLIVLVVLAAILVVVVAIRMMRS